MTSSLVMHVETNALCQQRRPEWVHQSSGRFPGSSEGVTRHLSGLFQSLTVGADLGDGGHKDIEAAFRHGFKQSGVAVFQEGSAFIVAKHLRLE
jgi:hypothetical protein